MTYPYLLQTQEVGTDWIVDMMCEIDRIEAENTRRLDDLDHTLDGLKASIPYRSA